MYAVFRFKRGPPSGFYYIKPINQFYPFTGQHSVRNTLDCFHYPFTHVVTVVYAISENTILHTSPKDGISGEHGVRRLIGLSPDIYLKSTSALTLRLLMSYIYGAPSKARNANVVYIWTYVWQR